MMDKKRTHFRWSDVIHQPNETFFFEFTCHFSYDLRIYSYKSALHITKIKVGEIVASRNKKRIPTLEFEFEIKFCVLVSVHVDCSALRWMSKICCQCFMRAGYVLHHSTRAGQFVLQLDDRLLSFLRICPCHIRGFFYFSNRNCTARCRYYL